MGDEFELTNVEVIYNGLLQLDILNVNENTSIRVFVEPTKFFGMVGKSLQENLDAYMYIHFDNEKAD